MIRLFSLMSLGLTIATADAFFSMPLSAPAQIGMGMFFGVGAGTFLYGIVTGKAPL